MKSNIQGWRELHSRLRYYDTHPNYIKKDSRVDGDLAVIASFLLRQDWNVAVIGAGYGRETALIAPSVRKVFAIDVRETLPHLRAFLGKRKISNVVEVDAEDWRAGIQEDGRVIPIDFVYSLVTFQHLTRDLVRDYIYGFHPLLIPGGVFLAQFSESPTGTSDADERAVEPNVRWTREEISELIRGAGYSWLQIRTISGIGGTRAKKPWIWHWAFFGKNDR
jgi:cyclopropane fatty-acyl-phospholipid synthase-like methyltransferase